MRHLLTCSREKARAADRRTRWYTLQKSVDRRDDDGRICILRPGGESGERGKPFTFNIGLGRHAVIGKTIPRRKRQHAKVGREKDDGIRGGLRRLIVRGDKEHDALPPSRGLRRQICVIAARRAADGKASLCARDVTQTFHVGFCRLQIALS